MGAGEWLGLIALVVALMAFVMLDETLKVDYYFLS